MGAQVPTVTRREFLALSTIAAVAPWRTLAGQTTSRPVPTKAQLAWQEDELALFLHFGVNTFTDREWGDGREDPTIFAPARLDARQWARAARAAGFRAMILTAKHHDGFCLWPTKTTTHSVASSPWRSGRGDVVSEFTNACRAEGLKAGLYLSPWDRHEPRYGDSPRYDDLYCDQLTELLTRYGTIHEVWFDGANGEGPNGKKQRYDWDRYWALVRKLQPQAVMFSDAGPDVRWIGNERGAAGETNWSTVDPMVVAFPGATGSAVTRMLQQGDPAGTAWRPGETDVSIRPGWFHHPAEDARVKSVDDLVSIYFTSVGRNSKLLLNVPPTRDGVLHPTDVSRLSSMHAELSRLFPHDLAAGRSVRWQRTGGHTAISEIDLRRDVPVSVVDLSEDVTKGQVVARYTLEGIGGTGEWRTLSHGTTIGYRKLDRLAAPRTIRHVRLRIEDAIAPVEPVRVRLF
ncbi:MAG TPA: alpha-L-fucosidase [Vicinamibacterales bacterium]|nr:alpha-L-fucosidase [Vicinamibacterales bacterium]